MLFRILLVLVLVLVLDLKSFPRTRTSIPRDPKSP
jgi:hypothetical protein